VTRLDLDPAQLSSCVACGLCLPYCPTYRVTGDEARSPRGRIALMRAVEAGVAPIDDQLVDAMETCVQCRGCEPACPSGVPFGALISDTRTALATSHRTVPRWQRLGFSVLGHPRLLRALSLLAAVGQRLHVVPTARLGLPARLPLRRDPLVATPAHATAGTNPLGPTATDIVYLFTGCVMDAWQRDVHQAAQRVLESAGATVRFGISEGSCCGALHEHAGLRSNAQALARRAMAAYPGGAPILVDAAGCGAALKDYGHLLGTPEANAFAGRVLDVHEWLAARIERLPPPAPHTVKPSIVVQDPCHLRHVQRTHGAVRTVLARYADLIELDDDGLCCGAGGAYSALEPELAQSIRQRKLASIDRAAGGNPMVASANPIVASANPGCQLHLAAAGVDARHPLSVVDVAIRFAESQRSTRVR
jgi:glycolate oxidase iron-sulfur subunit